ncbi:MAG: hypothetical protein HY042_06155 [Spirochaetia bacterium]|nr:hypothetical protein [Spirochaetia bacterium]
MANFLIILVEVCFLVLQHPEELPVYIRKIPTFRRMIGTIVALSAFSNAIGIYITRDYYEKFFVVPIIVLAAVQIVVVLLWSLIVGALVDAIVRGRHSDRPAHTWTMISIIVLSTLPFVFFLPGAIPAHFTSRPLLLLIPLFFALFTWSAWIVVRGLQYLYELSLQESVRVFVRAILFTLAFPGALLLLASLDLLHLVS